MIVPTPQPTSRMKRGESHASPSPQMTWTVYILECADGSLYTGITNDLDRRMRAHASGRGAKYTKRRGPFTVRYTELLDSKGAALQREAAIKSLDRTAKTALLEGAP